MLWPLSCKINEEKRPRPLEKLLLLLVIILIKSLYNTFSNHHSRIIGEIIVQSPSRKINGSTPSLEIYIINCNIEIKGLHAAHVVTQF